jgi:AmiR/NasT family two-component response regulator
MDRLETPIDTSETPPARFLRYAEACRTLELERLIVAADLVKGIGALIHSLQRERGVSSIFLGSNGGRFGDRRDAQARESRELERRVRARLERIDEKLDRTSLGARFYVRVAFALAALDTLAAAREQIAALAPAPQDAVKVFTDIIGALLAVGFEAANIAADPAVSQVLIALVSFAQGKEYAGQERATAGAGISRGRFDPAERHRLQQVQAAQERAFEIFAKFAGEEHAAAYRESMDRGGEAEELARMREAIAEEHSEQHGEGGPPRIKADEWYDLTTRRIDKMKAMEDRLTADLERLCAGKLAQARARDKRGGEAAVLNAYRPGAPVAMLIAEIDSPAVAEGLGVEGGIGCYALDAALPKPMRSILGVIEAQSRHIDDIRMQLESARLALTERKSIERAKGLLMKSRRLSENEAYSLMRQTAMKQNKRMHEVAEAILSMADLLR